MSSLGSFVRNVPFSPAITGSLLYALTRSPTRFRQSLLQKLGEYFSVETIARAITTLKWLCAFGIVRNLNIWLSNIAQNNFRLRSERHRYNWPNEIAVVTGAASGFGALITKDLASKGINVMAVDRSANIPDDMKTHPRIQWYQCDVADREKVMELADKIRNQYGDPSILVNNAGVAYQHSILDASEKGLRHTFDVNIISHYWTLQAFLPAMIANKKGHVVALASMASFITPAGMAPYCNTKAAVMSLHEGLKQEVRVIYKAPEVKFTIVHPTFADTPMVAHAKKELLSNKILVRQRIQYNQVKGT